MGHIKRHGTPVASEQLHEMPDLVPEMCTTFSNQDHAQKLGFIEGMKLTTFGDFPVENAYYKLFLEVVGWYSIETKDYPNPNSVTAELISGILYSGYV